MRQFCVQVSVKKQKLWFGGADSLELASLLIFSQLTGNLEGKAWALG
jgi:hypothetical protein